MHHLFFLRTGLYTEFIGDQANYHTTTRRNACYSACHSPSMVPNRSRRSPSLVQPKARRFVCTSDLTCLPRALTHGRQAPLVSGTERSTNNGKETKRNRTYRSTERKRVLFNDAYSFKTCIRTSQACLQFQQKMSSYTTTTNNEKHKSAKPSAINVH